MPSMMRLSPGYVASTLASDGVSAGEFRAFWEAQATYADITFDGVDFYSALCAAAQSGSVPKISYVAGIWPLRPASQGGVPIRPVVERALQEAAKRGHTDAADALIELRDAAVRADHDYGHDEDEQAVATATGVSQLDKVALVVRDGCFLGHAICRAAENGHVDVLRLLLADTDREGHCWLDDIALNEAVRLGHVGVVRLFVDEAPARRGIDAGEFVLAAFRSRNLQVVDLALENLSTNCSDEDRVDALTEAYHVLESPRYRASACEWEDLANRILCHLPAAHTGSI